MLQQEMDDGHAYKKLLSHYLKFNIVGNSFIFTVATRVEWSFCWPERTSRKIRPSGAKNLIYKLSVDAVTQAFESHVYIKLM